MRLPGALHDGWDRLVMGSTPPGAPDRPEHVLSFWFGRPPRPRFGAIDALWLPTRVPFWAGRWAREVLDVDGIIGTRFGELHRRGATGELDHWCAMADGRLALVILLDQLSRNIHRGKPAAFANDEKVLPIVEAGLALGQDRLYNPLARSLLYLPLMHHEDVGLLDRCVGLYQRAYAEATGIPKLVLGVELASGRRHRDIVARFGRYPHRNAILGRESTPEEQAFLKESFSSF